MKKVIVSATLMLAVYVSYGSPYGGGYYSNSYGYYPNDYYYPQNYSYQQSRYYRPSYYTPQYYGGGYYSSNNNYYTSAPRRSSAFPDPNYQSTNGTGGLAGFLTGIFGY